MDELLDDGGCPKERSTNIEKKPQFELSRSSVYYLLRYRVIDRPNQVWALDISVPQEAA